jgi:polysaccharide deacetylase 2 family uncharacterized protein YibQ
MDDDTSEGTQHSWKGPLRGLLLFLVLGVAGVLAVMSLLKERPLDLREQTRSLAAEVDRILSENGYAANRTERKEEGQKADKKSIWNAYRYRIDLPPGKTVDDVRHILATGLASRGVAVAAEKTGDSLVLSLLGCNFAEVQTSSVVAQAPEPPAVAPAEVTPTAPAPSMAPEMTPVEPVPAETPEAPVAEPKPAPAQPTEPSEGYSPLTPAKPEPGAVEMPVAQPAKPAPTPEPKPAGGPRPKIAIIVDDGGYGGEVADALLALNPALTVSVLPNTPRGTELAQKAAARGFEVMLHMPMEAEEGGGKALFPLDGTMNAEQIQSATEKALAQVPGAAGVNNHEGSKFTGDSAGMKAFLETVKAHSLFFVDSRTSPLSLAAETAQSMGIRTASRDVFLDNDPDEAKIRAQFNELLSLARKNGSAIGICHFRAPTVAVLAELLKDLESKEGVDLVHASQVLH